MGDFFNTLFGTVAGPLFLVIGFGIMFFAFSIMNIDLIPALSFLVALSPICLPVALFYITFERWLDFTGL
jgi:hypothetical protein